MERVSVPAAPGRLISAVARIGYDTEVALCDLLDNSIDAGSHAISVTLSAKYDPEEGEIDTIAEYVIADDGSGMDRDTLIEAFTLGSRRPYPLHSLGKFGLGLKSAGLSLGNRIAVLSKTASMPAPLCAILSLRHVQESGQYEIDLGEMPDEYRKYWDSVVSDHGTVLVLSELSENQPRHTLFPEYLKRYCGVVYHVFLADRERALTVSINGNQVRPQDPLFMDEATANGELTNPQDWDGRQAHLLLQDADLGLTSDVSCEIAATHLVHPPSFESEGRRVEIRDHYMIEADPYTRRPRHGFYIYRNGRVIVMAERFHGVVSAQQQAWAFRGRLMFDESADEILSLDVKKRHCQLPQEARNNLLSIIKNYHSKSVEAWKAAGRRVAETKKESKEEWANESISQTPVVDLGYAPGADLSSQAAIESRKRLLTELEQDTLQNIVDTHLSKEELERRAEQKSAVVFAQGLKGNAMWLPYPAVQYGAAETLINQAHSWIARAYASAEQEPRITLILHQLFTILARAELEVRSAAWRDMPQGTADKVLERFRRKASAIGEDLADTLAGELEKLAGETGSVEE